MYKICISKLYIFEIKVAKNKPNKIVCISRLFSVFSISASYFQDFTIIPNATMTIPEHNCVSDVNLTFKILVRWRSRSTICWILQHTAYWMLFTIAVLVERQN